MSRSIRLGSDGAARHNGNDDDDDDEEEEASSSDLEHGAARPLVSGRERQAAAADRAALLGRTAVDKASQLGKALMGTASAAADRMALLGKGGAPKSNLVPDKTVGGAHIASVDSSLDRTHRALAETARLGEVTSLTLQAQRESLLRQKAQLALTDEHLARSKGLLTRMQTRLVTDKLVQGVIIIVELALIGLIIYVKYYAPKS